MKNPFESFGKKNTSEKKPEMEENSENGVEISPENIKVAESEAKKEWERIESVIDNLPNASKEAGEKDISADDRKPESEKIEKKKGKEILRKIGITLSSLTVLAVLTVGVPGKAKAENWGRTIGESFKKGTSRAIENSAEGVGRGLQSGFEEGLSKSVSDVIQRTLGGGITSDERRRIVEAKIRQAEEQERRKVRLEDQMIRKELNRMDRKENLEQRSKAQIMDDYRKALGKANDNLEINAAKMKMEEALAAYDKINSR